MRYVLIILGLTVTILAYWLKVQIGMDFFDSLSISSYFPFKYLKSNEIMSPEPGILLDENFNKKNIFKKWSDLWMREDGTVTKELSFDGFIGSRCLLIKSSSNGSWTYSHNKRVEVKKGDIFYFEGLVNINGDNTSAYLSVAAFDKNKKVIDWNLFKEKVHRTDAWFGVEKHFTINDDNIKYINFRLVGIGMGEYRFDDITFRKIK